MNPIGKDICKIIGNGFYVNGELCERGTDPCSQK